MRFVIKDHDAGHDEGPKLAVILARKFVRLSRIGIAIPLWRVWLLENTIGVGCTPRVPKIAGWHAWWARWTWGVVLPQLRLQADL